MQWIEYQLAGRSLWAKRDDPNKKIRFLATSIFEIIITKKFLLAYKKSHEQIQHLWWANLSISWKQPICYCDKSWQVVSSFTMDIYGNAVLIVMVVKVYLWCFIALKKKPLQIKIIIFNNPPSCLCASSNYLPSYPGRFNSSEIWNFTFFNLIECGWLPGNIKTSKC